MIAKKFKRYASAFWCNNLCTFFHFHQKKITLLALLLILAYQQVAAQKKDSLFLKNGSYFSCTINKEFEKEVDLNWWNLDAPLQVKIPVSSIYKIKYGNGTFTNYLPGENIKPTAAKATFPTFLNFPLTRNDSHYWLGPSRLSFKDFKELLNSKNDSALNQLVLKVNREEKLQVRLLTTFTAIELPAAFLAVVYIGSLALEGIGVVGITSNKKLLYYSCGISGLNLATLVSFFVVKGKKNKYRLQAAKLYNQNYFANKYHSFD